MLREPMNKHLLLNYPEATDETEAPALCFVSGLTCDYGPDIRWQLMALHREIKTEQQTQWFHRLTLPTNEMNIMNNCGQGKQLRKAIWHIAYAGPLM